MTDDLLDAAYEREREKNEASMMSQAEEQSEYPPIVVRFLKRKGAVIYGSFVPGLDDTSVIRELRNRAPKGHLGVEFDNWPEKPRKWFIGSEPHEMKELNTGAGSGVTDVPYPMEAA